MKMVGGRILNITIWTVQGCLALLFAYSGVGKWNPQGIFWIELFAKIGIGQWFRYFIGGLEILGAIALLIPKTSAMAATFLALIMAGAVVTHLFIVRDGYASFFPAFTLSLLIVVAWKRRVDSAKP